MCSYPTIDLAATGRNIVRLRQARGLTVRDLQAYFGFDDPQAIYRWQWGKSLPSVDNLYALSVLLGVSMNEILVPVKQQAEACCSFAVAKLQFRRQAATDRGPFQSRPKVPMRKLSPSSSVKTEIHAPGFYEFAQQILFHARYRAN